MKTSAATAHARRIDRLEAKATRISSVLRIVAENRDATSFAENAGLLVERIQEWVDELREMLAEDHDDLSERIDSFAVRLRLAERKMALWPLNVKARRTLFGRKREAVAA